MKKFSTLTALASATTLLAMAASTVSQARGLEDLNGYVGAKYGAMSVNSSEFDDDADAFQVLFGGTVAQADFGASFNLEAGYHQFDEFGQDINRLEAKGYSISGVGLFPVTETVSLFAKVGNLWWDADYSVIGLRGEANESDYFYGAGARLDVIEDLHLTLSYDRYKIDLNDEFDSAAVDYESDLNLMSLGVAYNF